MKLLYRTICWGRCCLALLLVLSLWCGSVANSALAAGQVSVAMPILSNNVIGFSAQSGLHLKVDCNWVGTRGYWPFQIQVVSPAASTADRQITIRFTADQWHYQSSPTTVEEDFELAEGDTTASLQLLVPQFIDWTHCSWEVWVDGKLDRRLSVDLYPFNRSGDNASMALVAPRQDPGITITQPLQVMGVTDVVSNHVELPERWLEYSTVDVIFATAEALQRWKSESSAQFEELLRWVRAGGNLWVVGTGSDLTKLPQVEEALGISGGKQSPDELAPGWQYLPFVGNATEGIEAQLRLRSADFLKQISELSSRTEGRGDRRRAVDSRDRFVTRAFGMGTVTVFRDPENEWTSNSFRSTERSLLAQRNEWEIRHGNDPSEGNYEFYNFLIPDVGTAPVFEFQFLMTLFVIGIGPVNYWLLKRSGRLPLLLVTVPAAAVTTTLLLFAYGVLSEGLSSRVRARSFTILDQRSGEAACWARLSYYVGKAPAKGLQMPDDVAVYPILPWSRSSYRLLQSREILWGDPANKLPQQLSRGWLAARTPTQYQTITSRPTNKRIEFRQTDEAFIATNHLGVDVTTLVVQDGADNFYTAGKLAAGESIALTASTKVKSIMAIRNVLNQNDLQFPAGADDFSRRRYRQETLSKNLMETELAALISPTITGWGSRSYVAFTTAGVELDLGLEDVIEQESCHVIRGSW